MMKQGFVFRVDHYRVCFLAVFYSCYKLLILKHYNHLKQTLVTCAYEKSTSTVSLTDGKTKLTVLYIPIGMQCNETTSR